MLAARALGGAARRPPEGRMTDPTFYRTALRGWSGAAASPLLQADRSFSAVRQVPPRAQVERFR
jgi:hypothetical protein